ncbi:hypothetical protein ACFYY2_12110 [Streptomyces sp. NPDC001822]|uniref:hypothetical protein n=1 Tax=Streptomyces sp. NPDC001822 TaxID=3364614 RepID=UPI0036C0F3E8
MRIPFFTTRRNRHVSEIEQADAIADLLVSHVQLADEVRSLTDQMAQLVKLNQRRENLVTAAMDVADGFDNASIASDAAPHFTESELTPLLRLFHAAGRYEAAEIWERLNDIPDVDPFAVQSQTVNA